MNESVFLFLQDLAQNNNKKWFDDNKSWYQDSQKEVLNFVENLLEKMYDFDTNLTTLDAKKSLFRIYRDTRFSANKQPYKTNFGANLGMKKGSTVSGYYLHIEPGNCFVGGGVYMPDAIELKKIRTEISAFGTEFLSIINQSDFKNHFGILSQEAILKKIPQGFDKDDTMADYLKLKNFVVIRNLKNQDFLDNNAIEKIASIFKIMKPLNDFLNAPFR